MWWAYTVLPVLLLVAIGLGAYACVYARSQLSSLSDSVRDIRADLQSNYVRAYDLQSNYVRAGTEQSRLEQKLDSSPNALIPVDPTKPVGPCLGGPCAPVNPCDAQCNLPKGKDKCDDLQKRIKASGDSAQLISWTNGACTARFPLRKEQCDVFETTSWKPDPDKCATILPYP